MVLDEAQLDFRRIRRVDEFERSNDRPAESQVVQDVVDRIATMKEPEVQAALEIGLGVVVAGKKSSVPADERFACACGHAAFPPSNVAF